MARFPAFFCAVASLTAGAALMFRIIDSKRQQPTEMTPCPPYSLTDPVMENLASGKAVTIQFDPRSGISSFLLPGIRIDLLVKTRSGFAENNIVFERVLLLSSPVAFKKGDTHAVTVLVTPEQARILARASLVGEIRPVMRNNPGTSEKVPQTENEKGRNLYGTR